MSKEQSAIVKGFAILMMLLYHLSCIPKIQDLDIFTSTLSSISHPILYFLVVSGYGLYCVYKQGRMTWSYLLKRSLKLYLAYWVVLLIFVFGIATWMYPDRFHYSPTGVVLNFLGWRWDYCKFTWFLLPYVLMCLSSKWVFRIIDRFGIVVSLIVAFLLYILATFCIGRYYPTWLRYHYVAYHFVLWLQTLLGLTVGASMAHMVTEGKSIVWDKLKGKNLLLLAVFVVSILIRRLLPFPGIHPFHVVLIIWLILHFDWNGPVKRVFVELGDKSMIMWFVQGFLAVYMFAEYMVQLRWPLLIWIVWTIVCYVVACLLKPVVNGLARLLRLS